MAAIQAELRACAAALAMPEYMLSGDASNANFSSTMVAEGPAVKTFEEMQADLIEADVEIMERQLQIAAKAGWIAGATEDDILEKVKVEAEPPIIKSENRLEEAQADQILLHAAVMSKETLAARHGLVYADERDKLEVEAGEPVRNIPRGKVTDLLLTRTVWMKGLLNFFKEPNVPTTTANPPNHTQPAAADVLQEYADNRGMALRVDRASGIILGVKLLGTVSRKGASIRGP